MTYPSHFKGLIQAQFRCVGARACTQAGFVVSAYRCACAATPASAYFSAPARAETVFSVSVDRRARARAETGFDVSAHRRETHFADLDSKLFKEYGFRRMGKLTPIDHHLSWQTKKCFEHGTCAYVYIYIYLSLYLSIYLSIYLLQKK